MRRTRRRPAPDWGATQRAAAWPSAIPTLALTALLGAGCEADRTCRVHVQMVVVADGEPFEDFGEPGSSFSFPGLSFTERLTDSTCPGYNNEARFDSADVLRGGSTLTVSPWVVDAPLDFTLVGDAVLDEPVERDNAYCLNEQNHWTGGIDHANNIIDIAWDLEITYLYRCSAFDPDERSGGVGAPKLTRSRPHPARGGRPRQRRPPRGTAP